MTPEAEFVTAFAAAIVDRNFDGAATMLAPGLQDDLPPDALRKLIRRARGDAPPADDADVIELSVDAPADLRDRAAEVTDDNYRGTFRVEFVPDPDLAAEVDYSYALVLVVVDSDDELAVGHLEAAE